MAFSDIENSEKLDIINIAIVENEEFKSDDVLKETFKSLSDEKNEDRLFNAKYTSEDEAKELLKNGEITGYLLAGENNTKVIVGTSGINETIFKQVVEEILQTKEILENVSEKEISQQIASGNYSIDYEAIYKDILNKIQNKHSNIKDISSNNLSYTMIEYYTLIAMACLYGGILGVVCINQNLANMSSNGKRVSVSAISKGKLIFSSVLASYAVQLIGLAILFLYTIFVLKVDYGNNLPLIILLTLSGALAGLSLGIAISTLMKTGENAKTGIVIAVTMLGCFLSGMMGITMKYIIDTNVPILNKINPASMITDGFYSLYYYDTLDRFIFNIASLLIFAFVMIFISYMSLRRQKYDSI